jgi:FAD/FMN-containing dehydrogenase
MSTSTDLLDQLRGAIGAAHVLAEGDLSAWEIDWRKRWRGKALAVVRPGSTAEVAMVVRACAAHGTAIVPQGGNTGLVGGGVPDDSGTQVLLSLQRLNRIRAIDDANLTLTAEAGCVLQTLQQVARDRQLLFPLGLAAEGSCTIGGNLATNAGGTQVLRWGNTRELCLGLEVVTAAGEVWDGLSGLRKDNTGYDLRDLFIGSEGTLGIITAATMKLAPLPAATTTALAACGQLSDCVALLKLARARLGAGRHLDRAAGAERCRRRGPGARTLRIAARWRDRTRLRGRRRGCRKHRPGACALAPARVDPAGPGRRRPEHQTRHFFAGVGHPGLRGAM